MNKPLAPRLKKLALIYIAVNGAAFVFGIVVTLAAHLLGLDIFSWVP